jgi:hypothetical protein
MNNINKLAVCGELAHSLQLIEISENYSTDRF